MQTNILGSVDELARRLIERTHFGKENGQLDSYEQMLKREGRTGSPAVGTCPVRPGAGAPSTSSSDGGHESDGSRLEKVDSEDIYSSSCPFRPSGEVKETSTSQRQEGRKSDTIDARTRRRSRL
eukprot:GHVS01033422.1.p1 GENE.GHVS01033422.1~~GHVS01033422.1.p1  ORF type:complete len:124 (+),score=21.41 GHVS01033422.1:181-552(+)